MIERFGEDEAGDPEKMRSIMGPGAVDNQLRQAIHFLWMITPKDKRSIDMLEQETRRLIDRIFRDLREDEKRFGKP